MEYTKKTKWALELIGEKDGSCFAEMSIEKAREIYPNLVFSKDFINDMMKEGYFQEEKGLVKDTEMSVRLQHILERNHIVFWSDLNQYSKREIMMFRNMGVATYKELEKLWMKDILD